MSSTSLDAELPHVRNLFCILNARSLPYAGFGIQSLFAHSRERLDLTLITDDDADKAQITSALQEIPTPDLHRWRVYSKREADERADKLFARYPNLHQFRHGHPCWRKVTDPLLFAAPGSEMIILDPDLYFPNYFAFEPTPAKGLLLMWQPPSCLLPDEVVERAFGSGIRLAHHVDIGVAQLHNNLDLEWLDGLIETLGGDGIPRAMHVEAIIWAALAMKMGGGYLDPRHWVCYQYQQWKRLALRFGVKGSKLLRLQSFRDAKCFHAGGAAKWWLKDMREERPFPLPGSLADSSPGKPFEELTEHAHHADRRLKRLARRLGYYRLMGS
jgi:hypothetical protein